MQSDGRMYYLVFTFNLHLHIISFVKKVFLFQHDKWANPAICKGLIYGSVKATECVKDRTRRFDFSLWEKHRCYQY